MLEAIGALAVWVVGAFLCFYVPVRTSSWWSGVDDMGSLILGFYAGGALLVVYTIATVIYFILT